jgi:hypothetical protein
MEFITTPGIWTFLAIAVAITLVFQFAFEGLVLVVGAFVLWALSGGRIKRGEACDLWKTPPKVAGGAVFYSEGEQRYMYRNFVGLIGFVAVLLGLTTIFGVGMWTEAI